MGGWWSGYQQQLPYTQHGLKSHICLEQGWPCCTQPWVARLDSWATFQMGSWIAGSLSPLQAASGSSPKPQCISSLLLHNKSPQTWGITNTHLSPLSFCGSRVWAWLGWVLCSGSIGYNQAVSWAGFSSGDSTREESASELTEVFSKIQLFVVVGLRALAFCWEQRSAPRGHPQFPAVWSSHNMTAYYFKATERESLSPVC